jgi:hypothetical protein
VLNNNFTKLACASIQKPVYKTNLRLKPQSEVDCKFDDLDIFKKKKKGFPLKYLFENFRIKIRIIFKLMQIREQKAELNADCDLRSPYVRFTRGLTTTTRIFSLLYKFAKLTILFEHLPKFFIKKSKQFSNQLAIELK